MIRVLHFAGIINRHDIIDTVLTRLDRSRFEISALTSTPSRRPATYCPTEAYPTRIVGFTFTRRTYARMLWELKKEIRRFRPHILQAHHYDENIVAAVAVNLYRVPCYIIGRHYSDHIYTLTRGLKRRVFLGGERFCNHQATRIAVPSQEVADLLTKVQGVPVEKIEVIPFGLDFSSYRASSPEAPQQLRRDFGIGDNYMIMTSCRLNREKALEYLLQAMPSVRSRNPNVRLVLLGNGPYEGELRRWCNELKLNDTVQFVGWRDDALDWIAAADLVVQPSFSESFCQVLAEALAFGKPMIMTPVGAGPEVIGNNERGRLVPSGDSTALARAIIELMDDRQLGTQLGQLGQAYIHQHLGADRTARRYENLYEEALAESRCS